jgi:hypothetical protein
MISPCWKRIYRPITQLWSEHTVAVNVKMEPEQPRQRAIKYFSNIVDSFVEKMEINEEDESLLKKIFEICQTAGLDVNSDELELPVHLSYMFCNTETQPENDEVLCKIISKMIEFGMNPNITCYDNYGKGVRMPIIMKAFRSKCLASVQYLLTLPNLTIEQYMIEEINSVAEPYDRIREIMLNRRYCEKKK